MAIIVETQVQVYKCFQKSVNTFSFFKIIERQAIEPDGVFVTTNHCTEADCARANY